MKLSAIRIETASEKEWWLVVGLQVYRAMRSALLGRRWTGQMRWNVLVPALYSWFSTTIWNLHNTTIFGHWLCYNLFSHVTSTPNLSCWIILFNIIHRPTAFEVLQQIIWHWWKCVFLFWAWLWENPAEQAVSLYLRTRLLSYNVKFVKTA